MADSFHRLLRILQIVPRAPKSLDTEAIAHALTHEGLHTEKRTLQRDLVKLEAMGVGLVCVYDKTRPYRWSFAADAPALVVPGLDPQAALALRLVELHLERLLPKATLRVLKPQLHAARKALDGKPMARWLDRVRLIPRSQGLIPPHVDNEVLGAVQEALLEGRQLAARYRSASTEKSQEMILHPLGLVHRDFVTVLVATAWEFPDPRAYVLHRMSRAEMLEERARALAGFDLDAYVDKGDIAYRHAPEPIKVALRFDRSAARVVEESPLSKEQKLTPQKDGKVVVEAVLADTQVLRAWILGFGGSVEVLRPTTLRSAIATALQEGADRYRA